jgi:hypothetical protein
VTRGRALIAALLAATLGACSAPELETIRWRRIDVSPNQRGLVVRYGVDTCQEVNHAEVSYGQTQVVVTLFVKRTDARCLALRIPKSLVVPLHEPLDGRRVEDGGK